MAGRVRLFEKTESGLREVAPAEHGDRPFSRVCLEIDVLWTDAEIAARAAEEAAARAAAEERAKAAEELAAEQHAIAARIGVTVEELRTVLRGAYAG